MARRMHLGDTSMAVDAHGQLARGPPLGPARRRRGLETSSVDDARLGFVEHGKLRQDDTHAGARIDLRLDEHVSTDASHSRGREREAHTERARAVRREERAQCLLADLGRHADPVVADLERDRVTLAGEAQLNPGTARAQAVNGRHGVAQYGGDDLERPRLREADDAGLLRERSLEIGRGDDRLLEIGDERGEPRRGSSESDR